MTIISSIIYWAVVLLAIMTCFGILKHIHFCIKQSTWRSGWKSWRSAPFDEQEKELMNSGLRWGGWQWYNVRLFVVGLVVRLVWILVLVVFAHWFRPEGILSRVLGL